MPEGMGSCGTDAASSFASRIPAKTPTFVLKLSIGLSLTTKPSPRHGSWFITCQLYLTLPPLIDSVGSRISRPDQNISVPSGTSTLTFCSHIGRSPAMLTVPLTPFRESRVSFTTMTTARPIVSSGTVTTRTEAPPGSVCSSTGRSPSFMPVIVLYQAASSTESVPPAGTG